MGESLVENKMGESITNIPCFQQSVSFGRFERDSLCWERWSTFPTNKYLEEVEKCSTPGSVAQKKAYFEAHYKQIAARRAELLLDQERQMKAESENYEMSSICNTNEDELDSKEVETDNFVDETDQQENEVRSFDGDVSVNHVHVKSNRDDAFNVENAMNSFDGKVSGEHVHITSNSDDVLNQDHEDDSFDGDVKTGSVDVFKQEHVVWDIPMLNQENETHDFYGDVKTGSVDVFKQEHVVWDIPMLNQENETHDFYGNVKIDSADGFKQENDVWDIPDEMSGHNDGALTINDISEVSNVIHEKCEAVNEFNAGDNTIDDAGEVVEIEVLKDIPELKCGIDVIHVEVKSEVTENFDKPGDEDEMFIGTCKWPEEEIASADSYLTSRISEFSNLKESAFATEDVPSTPEYKGEKLPQEKVKRTIVEEESGNQMKLANSKTMPKAILGKKIASPTVAKKKPASPVPKRTSALMPKSPMLSTPKSLKPEPTKAAKSASRPLDKKGNGFTSPNIKKTVGPHNKRAVPTSLHMSLSLGPTNSDTSSLTMRKSLIMESMGDKDIVKRAFKAFQNRPQMSPSSTAKSPATNQSTPKKTAVKGSLANILPKKNDGIGRTAKTTSTHAGQQGTRKTSVSPGVKKIGGADQRIVTSVAASFGPRVLLQGNIRKEDSKKLELKARTTVFEATQLQSKLKVGKAAQVNKSNQSINSKPILSSSYNNRQGVSVRKDDSKSQTSG